MAKTIDMDGNILILENEAPFWRLLLMALGRHAAREATKHVTNALKAGATAIYSTAASTYCITELATCDLSPYRTGQMLGGAILATPSACLTAWLAYQSLKTLRQILNS